MKNVDAIEKMEKVKQNIVLRLVISTFFSIGISLPLSVSADPSAEQIAIYCKKKYNTKKSNKIDNSFKKIRIKTCEQRLKNTGCNAYQIVHYGDF
ncbi:hypothetical protein [Candidatus Venteria ishoeyi]|uniref:Uncharacterized protein n=1 Tax=Candidatus Venteria ishoeyi TaxID=1899563 RepID=A0A1H6F7H5_9GAMM|nr:hypothetical protein [Candidatus Venteria ishoeyi]SEH05493.1 Uncharacterised protein [Candidatus Venteria ishoeyi]